MSKLKRQISLSIRPDESDTMDKLKNKGIKQIDIFRRGLSDYVQDEIDDITQNNVA